MVKKHPRRRLSQDERRSQRNKKIMSYVLVLLMVASVAGIYASTTQSSGQGDYVFEEYSFYVRQEPSLGNQYVFALDGDKSGAYFYGLPQDTLRLTSEGNLSAMFGLAPFYVLTFDGDIRYASFFDQIRYELDLYSGKLSVPAVFLENQSETLPVITCANATLETPVIELQISNETNIITKDDGCIEISAKNADLGLIRDRLLYTALGIIDE